MRGLCFLAFALSWEVAFPHQATSNVLHGSQHLKECQFLQRFSQRQLFLRGGETERSDACRMESEFACSSVSNALDSVRLSFLTDELDLDVLANASTASPIFAHQVFGENETIVGYRNPVASLEFAADSLLPSISFRYDSVVEDGATDVVGTIKRAAPADYVDEEELRQSLTSNSFVPLGEAMGHYSSVLLKKHDTDDGPHGNNSTREARYELRHIHAGPKAAQEVRAFLQRTQCLAIWFIEKASYIDLDDPNWSCVTVYEKRVDSDGVRYRLVGFTTLYRRAITALDEQALKELTPLADEVAARKDMVRLSIAQFIILPHFAARGHGSQLLRAVYKLARKDARVLDVVVEDPNDDFAAMRLKCDLAYLRDERCVEPLKDLKPPWGELQRKLKLAMPHLFVLADAVGSKAGQRGVKSGGEEEHFPTVAGVPVDLEWVYARSTGLGFTRGEIDDILNGITADDLDGVQSPQEGARRLLVAVYMAVVADLGEAEGLSDAQIDALLEQVDTETLLAAQAPRALALQVLPQIRKLKAQAIR